MDQFWTRIQQNQKVLGMLRCKVNRKTNTWSIGMTVKDPQVIELDNSHAVDNKSSLLRSVLILRVSDHTAILEAVSTRTKKGLIKDPLHWSRQSMNHDISHYSRMRLYMTIAEAFALQVLKCKEMRLYDAATVPIEKDGLQPLTILSLLQCGSTTQEKQGYSCHDSKSRHLLRTVRTDLGKSPNEAFHFLAQESWSDFAKQCTARSACTEDLDMCVRAWTQTEDSELARQAFQQWYTKKLVNMPEWNISLMKMRSPEPWMVAQNDRWKDTQ